MGDRDNGGKKGDNSILNCKYYKELVVPHDYNHIVRSQLYSFQTHNICFFYMYGQLGSMYPLSAVERHKYITIIVYISPLTVFFTPESHKF